MIFAKHNRVPEPPANITGTISFILCNPNLKCNYFIAYLNAFNIKSVIKLNGKLKNNYLIKIFEYY